MADLAWRKRAPAGPQAGCRRSPEYPSSGSAISGHDPADRFVMGLLRACADVVLIGAGTLRATPATCGLRARLPGGRGRLRRPAAQPGARRPSAACRRHRPRRCARRASRGARRRAHPDYGGRGPAAARAAPVRMHDPRPGRTTGAARRGPARRGPRLRRRHDAHRGRPAAPRPARRRGPAGGVVPHRLPGAARPGLVAARELLPGRTELAELLSVRQHGSRTFTSGTGCAARTG